MVHTTYVPGLNVNGHGPGRRVLLVWRADALVGAAPAARGRMVDGLRGNLLLLLLPGVTSCDQAVTRRMLLHGATGGVPIVVVAVVGMMVVVVVECVGMVVVLVVASVVGFIPEMVLIEFHFSGFI